MKRDASRCEMCDAPRWDPSSTPAVAPPSRPQPGQVLGTTPWFFALASIFLLVWATSALAVVLNAAGRARLAAGVGGSAADAAIYSAVLIAIAVILAGLHGLVFYDLRGGRRRGWITAIVLAALWSLILVGLPVLVRLLGRRTRQAFGFD